MKKIIIITAKAQKIELTASDLKVLEENKELNIPLEINIQLKYLK